MGRGLDSSEAYGCPEPPGKNRGSDQKTFDDASLLISVFSSQRLVRSGSICSGRWDVVHFAGPQW